MADDTGQQQANPDVQGVLTRLFSGGVGNAEQSLKNLSSGISSSNEIARLNNEKGRNFYENYNSGGNLALLGMAAGIGKSNGPGNVLGDAFEGYGSGLLKQRTFDFDKQAKLQVLQDAQAALARKAAEDQFNMSFTHPLEAMKGITSGMGTIASMVNPAGPVPAMFSSNGSIAPSKGVPMGIPAGGGGIESSAPPMPQGGGMPSAPQSVVPMGGGAPAAAPGTAPAIREITLPQAQQIMQAAVADPEKFKSGDNLAILQQAWGISSRALAAQKQQAQTPAADPNDPFGTVARANRVVQGIEANRGLLTAANQQKAYEDALKTLHESPQMAGAVESAKSVAQRQAEAQYAGPIEGAKESAKKRAENAETVVTVYDENGVPHDRLMSDQIAKLSDASQAGKGNTESSKQSPFNAADVKTYEAFSTDAQKHLKDTQTTGYQLKSLANIYNDYKSGRTAAAQAEMFSIAKDLGIKLDPNFASKTGGFDAAMKTAVAQAFKVMQENGANRAPATALRESLMTVPSPTNDPAANYKIITEGIAANKYLTDMYSEFADSGQRNINKFLTEFGKTHDYKKYVERARGEVGPFKGMQRDNPINALRPGGETPSTPVRVSSPDEAHKLAPGTHYITPDNREFTR